MPLSPGQVVNSRYRIVKLLGQGGFGAVYRAWDLNLSKTCALKENLETSPEAKHQFKREAQLLSKLSHPNLPRVTDHFFLPGHGQYLVMDFVEGEDLQEKLDRQGPLPEAQVLHWIRQVCQALAHLHSQTPPIVHRDLKPANIRITPDGKAMLVDFGIAKIFDPSMKTTVGARAITPGFSPPEQYGQGTTDTRSDIYALGATLYTLLTGHLPPESVARIASRSLTLPRQIKPEITLATEAAIMRAMELGPETRYQAVTDFLEAITKPTVNPDATLQVNHTSSSQATGTAPGSKPVTPVTGTPPLTPWIWLGSGVALVAVCLCLIIAFRSLRNQAGILGLRRSTPTHAAESLGTAPQPDQADSLTPAPLDAVSPVTGGSPGQATTPNGGITTGVPSAIPASSTPSPIPSQTPWPTVTPAPTPAIFDFQTCDRPCDQNGARLIRVFPEKVKHIYFQWRYANIPAGAHYVRIWSMDGKEWVRYDCTWPYPSDGLVSGDLQEDNGLKSGTWQVEIYINEQLLMIEQVLVAGNWTWWDPAGTINACIGTVK